MRENIRNIISRSWPKFCDRVGHDAHHFGAALVPIICEKMFWVLVLSVMVFLALAGIAVLVEEQ